MRRRGLILLGVFCLLWPVSLAAAWPEDVRTAVARLAVSDRNALARAAFAGTYPQSELVSFTTHSGRWRADFHLPERLVRQFHDPAPVLLRLQGSPHLWSLHRRKAGTLDRGLSLITLTCYAPDLPGEFQRFAVASDGVSVTVTAGQMFGHPLWLAHLTMVQSERAFHLSYRLAAEDFASRRLQVEEYSQLAGRIGPVLDQCIVPVLRQVGAGRPGADIYRIFDQIPCDPQVTRQALSIVARLGADDVMEREGAAVELRRMGRQAMLATMRLDPLLLSPEQSSRLGNYWAIDGWVRIEDVDRARRDEALLESCLEDEDPAVRVAARNTLAALRAGRLLQK